MTAPHKPLQRASGAGEAKVPTPPRFLWLKRRVCARWGHILTIYHWNGSSPHFAAQCSRCWGVMRIDKGDPRFERPESDLERHWTVFQYRADTEGTPTGTPLKQVTVQYPVPALLLGIFPVPK